MAARGQSVSDAEAIAEDADTDQETTVTDQGEQPEEESALPLDQVFEILKNKRRRTVLHYLNDHEGTIALGDLAEHVAAVENDTTVVQVTSRERKCAYVGLYQCHLPKMDDMDIIDFNQNRGRIDLGPNASQLEQYLGASGSESRPWPLYYGATCGAGVALVLTTGLLAGSGGVPFLASVAALLGVAALAAYHQYTDETVAVDDWFREQL